MDAKNLFYSLMQVAYDAVYGRQQMLHYPLFRTSDQDLIEGQIHFTEYCTSLLPDLEGKCIIDVGCGNGVQTIYIHEERHPKYILGVDINLKHIALAKAEKERRGLNGIEFRVEDAEKLSSVPDSTFDIVICVESAHHYANKYAFLEQVERVLRPGGHCLIADLLRRDAGEPSRLERRLSLFHWPKARYRDAFASAGLTLIRDEDVTGLILPAFANTKRWFRPAGRPTYWFGMLLGQSLIYVYSRQLRTALQYQLMVCRKPCPVPAHGEPAIALK